MGDQVVDSGRVCVVILDVQGAESVKKHALNSRTAYVFISPPGEEALKDRLLKRGKETAEQIEKRLATARKEMEYLKRENFWDHILLNDDLVKAHANFQEFATVHAGTIDHQHELLGRLSLPGKAYIEATGRHISSQRSEW